MNELTNENGILCAYVDIREEDGAAWAIVVSWKKGVNGLPDARAWNEAIETSIARCREKGASIIDSRVITASEGVDEALMAARAAIHRDSLVARGFEQGEGRVEYRIDLEEALVALDAGKIAAKLSWNCVDTNSETELARAGAPAAVLALMAYPSDGWSTIYYLGVLPAFRGRGFGAEAMLHAFRCLKAMGGKTYQDGTGSRNAAARSLFARLGRPPFRTMEEWRLGK
jgi:ribosomal protein S18 acetylase RimI-like enzyme